jgi:hypothetical protein
MYRGIKNFLNLKFSFNNAGSVLGSFVGVALRGHPPLADFERRGGHGGPPQQLNQAGRTLGMRSRTLPISRKVNSVISRFVPFGTSLASSANFAGDNRSAVLNCV